MTVIAHVEPFDVTNFANPNYYWRYADPEFVRLVEEADQAAPEDFIPGMKKATRYLAEDAAAVWLFSLPNLVITKSTITGLPENQTTLSFDVTTLVTR
jgi:peptide/nickel transport system substrate-binding protein